MTGVIILFCVLLVTGLPIAFAMGFSGIVGLQILHPEVPLSLVVSRIFGSIDSFTLLAIPFFILAGEVMDSGGISQRLFHLARSLVGHIRGGLGQVVMVGGVFVSGLSGSTTADAAALSSIMVPTLKRHGFTPEKATALVCASSGMSILMPPCLSAVVYGSMTNTSIAALFIAGIVPTMLIAGMLMLHIYIEGRMFNVPVEKRANFRQILEAFVSSVLALMLPVIILVGIRGGAMTPTEAGAIAALYALVVGIFAYRNLTLRGLLAVLRRTGYTSGVIMLLIGAASVLSWLMALEQIPQLIAEWFESTGGGTVTFMLLSIVVFLLLFALLEGLPGMLMLIPIFVPLATKLGIDPLHYGTLMIAVTGISLFMPPIGVGLLVASKVAGAPIGGVGIALLPYLATMFVACLIIAAVPEITFVLPRILGMM